MIEFFILLLFILSYFNYLVSKDYKYPPLLYSSLWLIVLIIYWFVYKYQIISIYNISDKALFIFFLGALFFSIGGFTMLFISKNRKNNKEIVSIKINSTIDNLLFIIPIVFLPIYISKAVELSSSSGVDNFFIGLRLAINYGDEGYGYLGYIRLLAMFIFFYKFLLFTIFEYRLYFYKIKIYILGIISFIYVVLTTARIQILLFLSMVIVILLLAKKLKMKHVIIFVTLFFSVFVLYSILLNKGGDVDASFYENLVTAGESFLVYIIGGLVSFSEKLPQIENVMLGGRNTLNFVLDILAKFSIIKPNNEMHGGNFVFVPFKTNVFTVYYNYIEDFSLYGFFLIFYLLGIIHVHFYSRIKSSLLSQFMYAIMVFPVIMSTFSDQYFYVLSSWAKYFLLALRKWGQANNTLLIFSLCHKRC